MSHNPCYNSIVVLSAHVTVSSCYLDCEMLKNYPTMKWAILVEFELITYPKGILVRLLMLIMFQNSF